ncbi:acetylornithine deacetylase/succinyl-diaminopimelate desuccinylase-like protein [Alkalispirillum mobile]|uniref:Acetylornithine deacetylase/succinyl-diaminopimelate desuccinylase-like protein n=1 Tax=Alkalispirillum mobile TaxID=85925 RepID=A0A498BX71_9GAMM|nr:acetylornithine deacetylase [Alkalispirillum mobile]RLK48284.1 acetylornithine deacetylase/succinyl-diaminopimelate desuccinylase-like protein [Alkalispirillum mobile]
MAFSEQQQRWYEAACAQIDKDRLKQRTLELTRIHSPTGAEAAASRYLVEEMERMGLDTEYQAISELSGNAVGRLGGSGDGARMLLYAPVDTHLEADAAQDVPWVGPELRDDMQTDAYTQGDLVIGLGASNPKCMVTTLMEAVHAVREAGVPLKGEAVLAFAGGGMPQIVPERNHFGLSSGVSQMLMRGVTADFGIIFKPWWEIYHEHPGMCWFKVSVRGTLGYSGIPRGTPGFRSSIVPAAQLILALEEWLPQYTERNTRGQIAPEGWIAAVRSGWPEKPAFPSATTEIYLDLRSNPYQSTAEVQAEFDAAMREILARHPEIEADWEMYASVPGSRTPEDHWVVCSATRGWEAQEGHQYPGAPMLAGQTDAAAINKLGIPLVRIGYPWIGDETVPEAFAEGLGGMGVCNIQGMLKPCRALIYSIIDSLTRERNELEL